MPPDDELGVSHHSGLTPTPPGVLGGRYRVEQQIGAGGMAVVYRAVDLKHNRSVALKILRQELYDSTGAQRFLREIAIAANLTHPHIVPLHDSGEADGALYYVMPLIEGPSLRAKLRAEGRLSITDVVRILRDVADALGEAHAHGVVHRDIKPENIMMLGRSAVVTDFGVAKALTAATGVGGTLTVSGVTAGTPAYMAPEQIAADPAIDARADLYALGVVAYELLTGTTPFAGRTPTQLTAAIMTEESPSVSLARGDVPEGLASLVGRLLAKNPASRPASAAEVIESLDAIQISSPSVSSLARARAGPSARWTRAAVAVGVVLFVAGGVYGIRARARVDAAAECGSPDSLWVGNVKTVAVLPFVNTSGDTANEHFAAGLTAALTTALGNACGLRVAALSSMFPLKGKPSAVRDVANMGYASAIEASVNRAAGRIVVDARLFTTTDERKLWSEKYDRQVAQVADVIAVEEELAKAIVAALQSRSNGARAAGLATVTRDSAAFELYMKGIYDGRSRDLQRTALAVEELTEAIQRDSGYAPAYAALSDAYARRAAVGFQPPKDMLPLAIAAANRALALDPSLAEAYAAKGFALTQRMSLAEADSALRKAIQLNASYLYAHHYYSMLLMVQKRVPEALIATDHVRLLDPNFTLMFAVRGDLLLMQGDLAAAREALMTAVRLDPINNSFALVALGSLDAAAGNLADAVTHLEQAYKRTPKLPGVKAGLAYVYARTGRHKESAAMLKLLRADQKDLFGRAIGEAVMGNIDAAFSILDRVSSNAFDEINPITAITDLRINLLLEKFREDPRYGSFMRKLGLNP